MSDLLPFVSAVLHDRAALDAQEELLQLRRELDASRAVQVIRCVNNDDDNDNNRNDEEEQVVYASARFQDGRYSGSHWWNVNVVQTTTYHLADLRCCRICVAGGMEIESLDDTRSDELIFDCFLFPGDPIYDSDNSKSITFQGPICVHLVVHGWPREEWEAAEASQEHGNGEDMDAHPYDMIRYLVETVAVRHPNATVEFIEIAFPVSKIHCALKQLLPPRSPISSQTRDFRIHVARKMRAAGNQTDGSVLFIPQLNQVLDALRQLGIREAQGNEEVIEYLVSEFETRGHDGMEGIILAGPEEITHRASAVIEAAQNGEADHE